MSAGGFCSALLAVLLLGCLGDGGDVRQTVVTPLGLITEPNEQGQYPAGALSVAHNVHMRIPGAIDCIPDGALWGGEVFSSSYLIRRGFDLNYTHSTNDHTALLFGSTTNSATWDISWYHQGGDQQVTTPEITFTVSTAKLQLAKYRDLWYFTSDQGVLVYGPTTGTGATSAYMAGFPPPRYIESTSSSSTSGQAVANGYVASWRAVFRRENSDGAVLKVSPPSYAITIDNSTGSTQNYTFTIGFPDDVTIAAGDIIELYRTKVQTSGTDPGGTFYLAITYTVDSTDVTNRYAAVEDTVPDAALGAELYTNPGQEGALKGKFPPALASDVAIFKGHSFYVTEEEAPYFDVRIPATWGLLSGTAARTHGIGDRATTCDTVIATPNISAIANVEGLVAGQEISNANFSAGTTVVSVNTGAGTAVLSTNATANSTGSQINFYDRLEINGDVVTINRAIRMVSNLPDDNPAHVEFGEAIVQSATSIDSAAMRIYNPYPYLGDVTLRATNGQNYDPPLPEIDETAASGTTDPRYNRLRISELDQPWAVPPGEGNELLVSNGTIHRVIPTTDALYVFTDEGLFRVTGDFPNWFVDQLDPTLILASRNSVGVLRDNIWAYTGRGLVRISGAAVEQISKGLVGDSSNLPGINYTDTWLYTLACDEAHNEVHFLSDTANKAWVFNADTNRFATVDYDASGTNPGNVTTIFYVAKEREMMHARNLTTGSNCYVFVLDQDAASAATGNTLSFQPVTGDGDSESLKEWIDVIYNLGAFTTGAELAPEFGSYDQSAYPVTVPAGSGGTRVRAKVDVGREAALSPTLAPTLTITANAQSVARWRLYGFSARWVPAGDEGDVR